MQDQPTSSLNVSNLWSLARVLVLLLSVLSQVLRLQSSSCHPLQKAGIQLPVFWLQDQLL